MIPEDRPKDVRRAVGPEEPQHPVHDAVQRPHGRQQRPEHHAEADDEPDLGHQVAEPLHNGGRRALGTEPRSDPEVQRADHQRDDGVDPCEDDEPDDERDRDRGVDQERSSAGHVRSPPGSRSEK